MEILFLVVVIAVCAGIVVMALKPQKEEKKPTITTAYSPASDLRIPEKQAVVEKRSNIVSFYRYRERPSIWICSNCEAENENEASHCCVCYHHR